MQIVENGVFRIPLFHGTSSAFLPSIQALGLGAISPIRQYGVAGFLRELFALCDDALAKDVVWQTSRFAVQWIVDQQSFSDAANFQHGDTYLTPSRDSAVSYALTNRLGSELLTQASRVYELLTEHRPEVLRETMLDRHPAVQLFSLIHKPVLITARHVAVDALLAEGGSHVDETVHKLEELWQIAGAHGVVVNLNFRLNVPLAPKSFSVESVDPAQESNAFNW